MIFFLYSFPIETETSAQVYDIGNNNTYYTLLKKHFISWPIFDKWYTF